MYPRRSSTTHTEPLGDEASVYDWAHAQVHALNPTAARVWQLCDGTTSADAIAATLHRETGIPEADAVVDLTLKELARLHLLELPVDSREDRPAPTRRWLLERGLAAALLPAVYTILTPSPLEAQSPGGAPTLPTLTTVAPNQGTAGTTVAVTLTGTNFVAGATVAIGGGGVTVNTIVVGGPTSLTANFVVDPAAATGARTVTVTTPGGTSGGQTFTITAPAPGAPTLTSVVPSQGIQGSTVAVTLTGTNFVVTPGATTVNVSGAGVTVNTVVVGSTTSLTANFVLDAAAATGARTVTVTTAGGTSGGQTFTINPPLPTLASIAPNQGTKVVAATTVQVTLTGTNFVAGATVAVSGLGVTVNTIVVAGPTSLTANFVIAPSASTGVHTVTVTTPGGTTGGQSFTVNAGSQAFAFTGSPTTFAVPPGVTTLMVTAQGAQGGSVGGGLINGGLGGSVTGTLTVVPNSVLNIFVGGQGADDAAGAAGGFNGGAAGGAGNFGSGGGGASDIRSGGVALANRVIVAGGGGGGAFSSLPGGGAGGGTTGGAGSPSPFAGPVTGGGGGTQGGGGLGGDNPPIPASDGNPGASGIGGAGGVPFGPSGGSGGGGGGGYYGGGGGAGALDNSLGAGSGGGGSSFIGPGATLVSSTQGDRPGNGQVIINW